MSEPGGHQTVLGPVIINPVGLELTAADRHRLLHPSVGGAILFSDNFRDRGQLKALIGEIKALKEPSLVVTVDQEGGRVQRFKTGFTTLPAPACFGRSYDRDPYSALELINRTARLMALELSEVGVDHSFAPCVDLDHHRSRVIGDRSLHHDVESLTRLAGAWISGVRAAGMSATVKHFPGHGYVEADSHHELPVDERSEQDIRADMRVFSNLIEAGLVDSVMTAHVLYPKIDALPPTFSKKWLTCILRQELSYTGIVISDDLTMSGAAACGDITDRTRLCCEAGCDVLLCCNDESAQDRLLDEFNPDWLKTGGSGVEALRARPGLGSGTDLDKSRLVAELAELAAG